MLNLVEGENKIGINEMKTLIVNKCHSSIWQTPSCTTWRRPSWWLWTPTWSTSTWWRLRERSLNTAQTQTQSQGELNHHDVKCYRQCQALVSIANSDWPRAWHDNNNHVQSDLSNWSWDNNRCLLRPHQDGDQGDPPDRLGAVPPRGGGE